MAPRETSGELGLHVDLPPEPQSIVAARQFLLRALPGRHHDLDGVVLVASELVTNAVRHAQTPVRLTLHPGPPLRIEVTDLVPLSVHLARLLAAPAGPMAPHETSGRGIPIAHAVAARIGATDHGQRGKTIWAEFEGTGALASAARPTTASAAPPALELSN